MMIKTYIYIFIGGSIGAMLRYVLSNFHPIDNASNFPVNTLLINISGCLFITFFIKLTSNYTMFNQNISKAVTVGFLGAFTTFSTFCKETVALSSNSMFLSFIYVFLSVFLGLLASTIGAIYASHFNKYSKKIKPSHKIIKQEGDVK